MKLAVLIVMTSHDALGDSGKPTGTFLPEVAHAHRVFESAGLNVDFVSVQGGPVPLEGLEFDAETAAFAHSGAPMRRLHASYAPDEIDPERYAAIYFAGGHGTMWDFPDHERLQAIAEAIHRGGGVVSAVCHGPAGLVNLSNPDGTPLVRGRRIAAFTNAEERAVEKERIVPFALQTVLEERGAEVIVVEPFKENVVVDDRLVTGQNPASARGVAQGVLRVLSSIHQDAPPLVAAPIDSEPVVLTLRLEARDPAALAKHLLRVIPTTRAASGNRSAKTLQERSDPSRFLLVQEWQSLEQQRAYMDWREARGDLAVLTAALKSTPRIVAASLLDE